MLFKHTHKHTQTNTHTHKKQNVTFKLLLVCPALPIVVPSLALTPRLAAYLPNLDAPLLLVNRKN